MKKIQYLALALVAGALVCGCSDENEPSTQNRGKEKPVVTLTADEVGFVSFTFTIAASEQASQYAYAIFEGTGNPTPTAYDIVCDEVGGLADEDRANGNYSHYAFNVSEGASATHTFGCDAKGTYEIFAAAITETGLLSEVTKLTVELPVFELKAGDYTISYTSMRGSSSFPVYIDWDEEYPTECILYADWFNIFSDYGDPILVGEVDLASMKVVFDGTFIDYDGSIAADKAFGMAFFYANQQRTQYGVFFGSGDSGTEPIVASINEDGYLTDISGFEYSVYTTQFQYLGTYDYCEEGVMTYVPAEDEPEEAE